MILLVEFVDCLHYLDLLSCIWVCLSCLQEPFLSQTFPSKTTKRYIICTLKNIKSVSTYLIIKIKTTMGANMIIYMARLVCLNDCLIWNVFKYFCYILFESSNNPNLTQKEVVIYYYVNMCFKNLSQDMSC